MSGYTLTHRSKYDGIWWLLGAGALGLGLYALYRWGQEGGEGAEGRERASITEGVKMLFSNQTAYVNGKPVTIKLAPIGGGLYMRADAAAAYVAMAAAAAVEGVLLHANSAFRTWEKQNELYQLYKAGKGNLASPPGWGNHQAGIAVDIESANGTNASYNWLVKNGSRFGYVNTGANFSQREPWHWEFKT